MPNNSIAPCGKLGGPFPKETPTVNIESKDYVQTFDSVETNEDKVLNFPRLKSNSKSKTENKKKIAKANTNFQQSQQTIKKVVGNENRYSDADLAEFKEFILKKIEKVEADLKLIKGAYVREIDNADSRKEADENQNSNESNSQLVKRQEKLIGDLKNALSRVENKTYGVCKVTGKLIPKERLKLVPHATMSIEAKNMQR